MIGAANRQRGINALARQQIVDPNQLTPLRLGRAGTALGQNELKHLLI